MVHLSDNHQVVEMKKETSSVMDTLFYILIELKYWYYARLWHMKETFTSDPRPNYLL